MVLLCNLLRRSGVCPLLIGLATKSSGIHAGFDKLCQRPLAELVEANAFVENFVDELLMFRILAQRWRFVQTPCAWGQGHVKVGGNLLGMRASRSHGDVAGAPNG